MTISQLQVHCCSNGRYKRIAAVIAEFDALLSLAVYARSCELAVCLPEIADDEGDGVASVAIEDGVHPCLLGTLGVAALIANSVTLAGDAVVVLTGPNMGGKSTLMRQVALLTVLAQCVSCYLV